MSRVLRYPVLVRYRAEAFERAAYRRLEDDPWFADIPGFVGVWANAGTLEAARAELAEVFHEWLLLKLGDGDALPMI